MPSLPSAAELTPGASKLLVVSPQVFKETCLADIAQAKERAAKFMGSQGVIDGVAALDEYDSAVALLADASARASLARSVHPDEAMRDAAASCETEVEKATTELTLNRAIYDRMASLTIATADAATKHYVQKTLRDFRRAGVDKDDATRARIRTLRDELVKLGQQFDENIASDVRTLEVDPTDLDGLPEDFKRSHPVQPNGKVRLTTNNTDYQPFLTYSTSATARAAIWKLYRQRAHPKNVTVLKGMLEARQELATLLGFPTWADYITGDKMIGTKQNVSDFIDRIVKAADTRMKSDYAALLARRQRDVRGAAAVDAWDSSYYQEKVKAEQYNFDSQSVRPFFEYSRVKTGVMDITSRMFGITYRPVKDAAVWHADVDVYDVLEGTTLLGRIYLDMFPRDNKYKHYAQFTLTNGKSGRTLPEGVLVCNFPRPGAEPALMQHSDVETFFHEFGHLLHHVLGGHTRWAGIAGVATEWDFVEAPSQMLEEWVWTPETLQTFATHYKTGEPIPADLVKRMRAADEFGKGLFVRQQMFYASLSLQLHSREPKSIDMPKLVAEFQERLTPYRFVEDTYFEESFTHLNGYSAVYYTYMWSLVIAKDMFTVFNRAGLMNRDAALRYRSRVLEPGGSQPAADLVRHFLDRPYSFTAFEDWLNAN
ncbi:MAG: Zn-dependent oligopeptidase [Acidimicrobiia bacterium]|nr:Zn-dependent oligopeptidase [Acidimicrobiia bacterium]